MAKAKLRGTEVVVSHFNLHTKPEQWRTLLKKLKTSCMDAPLTDQAVIYLVPGKITTAQATKILSNAGFEVSLAI